MSRFRKQNNCFIHRCLSGAMASFLSISLILAPSAGYGQSVPLLNLPVPGTMVNLSPSFVPVLLKGMTIHPENPLRFDFIVDSGNTDFAETKVKEESEKLIKYFLASLTVPKDDLWVNLSPYEKNRIIPDALGKTELGRDMLAQDYILKQLTATLMYPENELGAKFWERVYSQAQEKYGITDIPMDTFNKVWILPESATIYEKDKTVYVVEGKLKVMLEEDYLARSSSLIAHGEKGPHVDSQELTAKSQELKPVTSIIREIIIPEIEKEVNEGKNFAPLRQIYYSLILAKWYKETIKNSLLSKVYVDKNKITGVDLEDRTMKEQIYDRYMKAYKKGVYDYIKEDYDAASQEVIPRKYFSGGEVFHTIPLKRDPAILARKIEKFLGKGFVAAVTLTASTVLTAVSSPDLRGQAIVPLGQTSVVNDVPTEQAKDVISYNQATLDKWRSHYTDKQVSWPEVLKGGLSLIYAKAARIYYDELPEKIRRIQERQTNKQTPSQYWDERWELLRSMARSEEKFQPSKDGMFVGGYPKVVSEYINQSLGSVIREILTKDPNKKLNILEIGAGDRFATIEHIAQTYAGHIDKLHTLDPAKPAKPFEGSTHFIGLAEDTGLPDNEYDLVTMFYTLSYTDMDKTLKELIRILRPGGKVIIVDHSGNAGVLNNHYLGFYVDMLSLKTLEQLKSNLKALLKSGDLGHVSPLEFSDFDLKKLAYKDFDFAHIPGFLPMLDGRNKFIREEIVEVINGSVQAENLDKKLIQKIMAKTVRRINGIVKYDAYTTRVTRNLFENTFDDPKSLTEYIRARGFDLEFNEVKGFAQLLPISKRDTIISPYAWGYVIKNFKKEQSFNDLSPEMKFLISLVGIGSIVGISVIIRSLIATAKDFKTIDILIKQHKNLVEGITPSVDPYRYLDEEFSLKRPAERLQIINNLLMPTNDEEVKKILPLLDDPYQEVRDRLVQILRWGVGELKISEDMKRTIYQVFVKILKDPKFSNLERGRIAKVLGDSGNRKYIIELEEALYKDTIDDNAQEFLLTNEDEIFQDEKELFIEEKKSEYFSKFLSHGDVMLALFKLGEKQYFVVFKKLLFLGYFIDSICDALAEKGSVGEIQEALEILIDQIKNIPKGSNTSEGHTEEYEVNSQYVNVQKAIHQLQKALKERASENGKPPDKALLVMSPVLLEMDGNVGKEAKTPGGIDLNTIDLNRQGSGADIQFDPAMMSEILENGVDGFRPVIINFTPITSVLPLLGLEPKGREESYEVSHLN